MFHSAGRGSRFISRPAIIHNGGEEWVTRSHLCTVSACAYACVRVDVCERVCIHLAQRVYSLVHSRVIHILWCVYARGWRRRRVTTLYDEKPRVGDWPERLAAEINFLEIGRYTREDENPSSHISFTTQYTQSVLNRSGLSLGFASRADVLTASLISITAIDRYKN